MQEDDGKSEIGEGGLNISGPIVAICALLAGAMLVIAFVLFKNRGGYEVASIVKEAVKSERITSNDDTKVVSDKLLVTLRSGTGDIAKVVAKAMPNMKVKGAVAGQPNMYIVSFPQATYRQLRDLVDKLKQDADVADVAMIPAE